MSDNIIIKVTFSISGHGKMVEADDIANIGQNPQLSPLFNYNPKNDGEVWVLGMKNAGVCSYGMTDMESVMDNYLKKFDLEEHAENYLEYLNNNISNTKIRLEKANRFDNFSDQTQWKKPKIQKEGNDWAYFQQTKANGNKIFGHSKNNSDDYNKIINAVVHETDKKTHNYLEKK